MKASKVLKAYWAGSKAKVDGLPSNAPPGLSAEEKKAWHNGYNEGWKPARKRVKPNKRRR